MRMTALSLLKSAAIAFCATALLCLVPVGAHAAETTSDKAIASLTVGEAVTYHDSFAAAIAAANNANTNCTITLLRDTEEYDGGSKSLFYIGKNGQLTIDFGDYVLTCDEIKSGTGSSMKLTGTTGGVKGDVVFYGPSRSIGDTDSKNLPDSTIESGVYHGTIKTWLAADAVIKGGTFTSDDWMVYADGAPIDICGGTFTAPKGIYAEDYNANVDIEGGTFTLTDGSSALMNPSNSAHIRVYGGTFYANIDASGKVWLSGGTFKGGIEVKNTDLNTCLSADRAYWTDDYTVATLTDGQTELSGDVTVNYSPAASLTTSSTTRFYPNIQNAVADFNSLGGTLNLEKDYDTRIESGASAIELTGTGTFDLNGYTLKVRDGSAAIKVTSARGNITITDTSSAGTGNITGSASYSIWHEGTRDVTVESGTYQNFGRFGNGSLIINGGTFESNSFGNTSDDEAKVILNGGTFNEGIWFTAGNNQTVYEILGDGKTYQKGDQIWLRKSIKELDKVYEFEKGNTVTVTDETNLIASYTNGTDTYYYTTLAAAIEKYNSEDFDESKCVTLLRDTDEPITISEAIYMVFKANATGIFTFSGSAIYLKEALPSNVSLQVKLDPYTTDSRAVLVRHNYGDFDLERNDITPVDKDAKVEANVSAIYVYHEHKWVYGQDDEHTVRAVCEHTESCTQKADTAFATVALCDTTVAYNGDAQRCSLETEAESEYNGTLPNVDDVTYYDESSNELDGAPTEAGSYTAKVTFGDKTAQAELNIEPATPTTSDFAFASPLSQQYDGQAKHASVEPASSVVGMGNVTMAYYDSEGNLLNGAPIDAGTYSVKISVTEGSNYEAAEGITDESWQFTIDPKEIGVEWADEPLMYNGKVQSPAATAIGVIEGDKVELVVTGGKKDVADTDAALMSVTAVSGEDGKNYALAKRDYEVQLSILPRPLTIDVVVEDKYYDGTSAATIASAELENVVEGDEVGLTNGIATFDSVQVANGINVSFTDFVLTGEEEVLENYVLIQPTGITASIIDNPEAANPEKEVKDNIAPTGDNSSAATIASISVISSLVILFALRCTRRSA